MFKWLKNLFHKPHFTDTWQRAPNLKVHLELSTGTLVLTSSLPDWLPDRRINLGAPIEDLSVLGKPSTGDHLDYLLPYPEFALLCTVVDQTIDGFSLDFSEKERPTLLWQGEPLESNPLSPEDLLTLYGSYGEQSTEEWGEITETIVAYKLSKTTRAEWSFEDGKLTNIEFFIDDETENPPEDVEENEGDAW